MAVKNENQVLEIDTLIWTTVRYCSVISITIIYVIYIVMEIVPQIL